MQTKSSIPRSLEFAIFLVGCLWLAAAHIAATVSARGFANRLNLGAGQALLEQLFFLLLVLSGYVAISWTTLRGGTLSSILTLPARPTSRQEWLRGAALGWAMLLIAALPMMLAGDLHPTFNLRPEAVGGTIVVLATLAVSTLAAQVAYRGFLFQRLIAAVGPSWATILLSLLVAVISGFNPYATLWSFAATFAFSLLLCAAYLRTYGLWLAWGLHFGFAAVAVAAFGLPLDGTGPAAALVLTDTTGRDFITGGLAGPLGAAFTLVLAFAALIPLFRITRDYAWEYTHPEIVPAGYPMDIAPPAAHTAMETAAAAAPVPLVQILGTTPTAASTLPVIDEHLRRDTGTE